MSSIDELPDLFTASQIAARFGISERRLREDARKSGHCRIIGRKMMFGADDVAGLTEFWKPVPQVPRQPTQLNGANPRGDYVQLLAVRRMDELSKAKPTKPAARGRGKG
ncbi:hypothetical protein [Devosia sp. CN2-171]|uniref:hypothetical protein n=1 Tax=Devosia sp. CN2-171 TaxID=3400909 RepID=UPI003BF7AED9